MHAPVVRLHIHRAGAGLLLRRGRRFLGLERPIGELHRRVQRPLLHVERSSHGDCQRARAVLVKVASERIGRRVLLRRDLLLHGLPRVELARQAGRQRVVRLKVHAAGWVVLQDAKHVLRVRHDFLQDGEPALAQADAGWRSLRLTSVLGMARISARARSRALATV